MDNGIYLSKRLGAFEVFTISSGTMIGAGVFVLPGIIARKTGASAILCFVVAGLIACCAALSICELATAMPMAGGSYYFISRSMGAMFGSIIGWGSLLGLVFKGAFAFVGAGEYVEVLVPVRPFITALALCAVIMSLNIAGTGITSKVQNLIVTFMAAIFLMYVGQGIFSVEAVNFGPLFTGGASSFLEATGLCFITFLGLIKVSAISEEVKNPKRDIPRGILSSVVFVTVIYCLVMFVTMGILKPRELYSTLAPIAEAANSLIGPGGLVFMVICGLLATISTGNAALLSSSRYPFAMSRDGLMPGWFAKIDSFVRTPARSIFIVGSSMFLLILLVDLENIVKIGSVFNMVVFALVNVSVIILRRARPSWYRPGFRSPLYPTVQILGVLGSLLFIPFMGLTPAIAAILLVCAGAGWFFLYGRGKASPDYRLRDTLRTSSEKKVSEVALEAYDSSYRHSWRLLVPLWFSQVPRGLLVLAGYMASHFEDKAHLVYCQQVPEQTPITAETPLDLIDCVGLEDCVLPLKEEMRSNFEFTTLYACSREYGFVEMARDYDTDLALMEWPPDTTHLMWEVNQLVRDMPCDVAFFVNRPMPRIENILVASGRPEDRLKLTVAGAIARESGATVTMMTVYPKGTREMSTGDLKMRILKSGVLYGVPLEPVPVSSDDAASEIVSRAAYCDLLIIGSAPGRRWLNTPFGPVAEEIIDRTVCPILVTSPRSREQLKLHQRIIRRLLGMP